MNEKRLTRIIYTLIIIGGSLVIAGVSLVVFTDIVAKQGVHGIALIAGLIAGGLFLSIPAKIYLTLQLMKMNDEKLRAQRERGEIR